MKIHDLKSKPEFFLAVLDGQKVFEVRQNDRDFQVGDRVFLREWTTEIFGPQREAYTGRWIEVRITYVTTFEQKEGYVVFGFTRIKCQWEDDAIVRPLMFK